MRSVIKFLILCCTIFIAVTLLYRPCARGIVHLALKWTFSSSESFSYTDLFWEQDHLVLLGLFAQDQSYSLRIDKTILTPHFSHLDVILIHPEITLIEEQETRPHHIPPFILPFLHIEASHGVIQYGTHPRLYFTITQQEPHLERLEVFYDPAGPPCAQMAISFQETQIELDFSLLQMTSVHLSKWLPLFFSSQLIFQEAEGLLSLHGKASWNRQGRLMSLTASADCDNWVVFHLNTAMRDDPMTQDPHSWFIPSHLFLEHLTCDLTFNPHRDTPIWENLKLVAKIEGGRFEDEQGRVLEKVAGSIELDQNAHLNTHLEGVLVTSGKSLPCFLRAQGALSSAQSVNFTTRLGGSLASGSIQLDQGIYHLNTHFGEVQSSDLASLIGFPLEGTCQGNLRATYGDNQWSLKSLDLSLHQFSFIYGEYEGDAISCQLNFNDSTLTSFHLQGTLCGLSTTISQEDSFYKMQCTGILRYPLAQQDHLLHSPITFEGKIFQENKKYELLGHLVYGGIPLECGATLQGWQFQEGWFHNKSIKSELYQPLLTAYLPHLTCDGEVGVLITLDPECINLALVAEEGLNVRYNDLLCHIPYLSLSGGSPLFLSYSFTSKTLQGKLPLHEAALSYHEISFEHLSCNLLLDHTPLHLETALSRLKAHYKAQSYAIPLEGDFTLEKAASHLTLIVDTYLPSTYPCTHIALQLHDQATHPHRCTLTFYDHQHELGYLAATCDRESRRWNFDPKSHLLQVSLHMGPLQLSSDGALDEISLHPSIPCRLIPYMIHSLRQFPFIAPDFGETLLHSNLQGEIALNLHYRKPTGWDFHLTSEKLNILHHPLTDLSILGRTEHQTLVIEELTTSLFSLTTVITKQEDAYHFDHLTLWKEKSRFEGSARLDGDLLQGDGIATYTTETGLLLKSQPHTCFSYHLTQGLVLDHLQCDLYEEKSWIHLGKIESRHITYSQDQLNVPSFFFSLSPTILKIYQEKLPSFVLDIKTQGGYLEGEGQLQRQDNKISFQGSLKEGVYTYRKHTQLLEKIALSYEQGIFALRMRTYLQEGVPLWIETHCNIGDLVYGMIRITPSQKLAGIKTLFTLQGTTPVIESIQGEAYGVSLSLNKGKKLPQATVLTGSIALNFQELKNCFSSSLAAKLAQLKMGSGYTLQGEFIIAHDDVPDLSISGSLVGKNTQILGFCFDRLTGKLNYKAGRFELRELQLVDPAGTIICHQFFAEKKSDWIFQIPLFQIKNLHPSQLKTSDGIVSSEKPFKIDLCTLHGIHGKLSDVSTWEGEGSLHFTNTFKKAPSFWDMPLDLFRKLGLDPGLLTPICGDIDLKLCGDKLYLDHLKNAFSVGEKAQFFLAVDAGPSYIDLDGNIQVSLRMRQDVLLKFTESLILTIRGTLEKPKYGLQY